MSYDRFDLEEQIMKCWNVVDDVNDLYEHIGDSNEFLDMPPKYVDKVMNKLLGVKELYDMRFQKLWDIFDSMVKEQQFVQREEFDDSEQLDLQLDDVPLVDTDVFSYSVKYDMNDISCGSITLDTNKD